MSSYIQDDVYIKYRVMKQAVSEPELNASCNCKSEMPLFDLS
jgi:hypothetical protein